MSDHAKFVLLAERLINKHGRTVTFSTLQATPTDDATKPWKQPSPAPVEIDAMAAFVPFRGFEFGSMFHDDELLKVVDEVCLVQGGAGALENAHLITDSGVKYKIEWARRLKPGDQTILYAFGVLK